MVSEDILGYPPKSYFQRMWLERAWKAIFGALDIGARDFYGNCEEFLKGNEDITYKAAKNLLISKATGEFASELKSLSNEEDQLIDAEREYLFEELGKHENIGEHARSYIERKEGENRALKEEIAQLRKHPKRKPAEKREPKQKPLVALAPAQPELSLLTPTIHGKDFNWLHNIIIADGLSDLELAAEEIKRPHTDLTEQDRKYLLELIEPRKAAYVQKYEKGKGKEIITKLPTSAPPQKKITTSREITRKREEGIKESKEEEQVTPFTAVEYEIRTINLQNAKLFLRDYQQHIPAMLQAGLQKWLETHRSAFKFPLTTHNIDSLSDALQYSIVQPSAKNIRGMVAVQFLSKHSPDILVRGLEKASGSFAWGQVYSYYKDTLKTDLPPIDKFKQDVLGAAKSIKFEFG